MSAFTAISTSYYTREESDERFAKLRGDLAGAAADVSVLQGRAASLQEQAASLAASTQTVLATLEARVEQLRAFVLAQLDTKVSRDAWPALAAELRSSAQDAASEAAHRVLSQYQAVPAPAPVP
jgi:hypothetical protein